MSDTIDLLYDKIVESERRIEALKDSLYLKQRSVFFSDHRKVVNPKGRRAGGTNGAIRKLLVHLCQQNTPALWVDTVTANIFTYVENIVRPLMREFGLITMPWEKHWNKQQKQLKVQGTYCQFASQQHPEHMEGFAYGLFMVNEAGIVLQDRNLWHQSILPMSLDYSNNEMFLFGTPKGKKSKKDGKPHLFFEKSHDDKWHSVTLSSYDNPHLSEESLREMIDETPPHLIPQQIYGEFIDTEGLTIFPRDRWKYYTEAPRFRMVVQSWDTAGKDKTWNDYSVCTTWGLIHDRYYLLDRWRGRVEFPELKRIAEAKKKEFNPARILVEDQSSGISLIQELQRGSFGRIVLPVKADRDKVSRANAASVEQEFCYLPETEWVEEFVNECENFPDGEFDDQVDSFDQAINYLKQYKSREVTPRIVTRRISKTGELLRNYEA